MTLVNPSGIESVVETAPAEHARGLGVVIAGGGTGGHLFPGISIAQAFVEMNAENRILFVGTGRPVEKAVLPRSGFASTDIRVQGIKGRGLFAKIGALLRIPGAVWTSRGILKRFGADLVIGVGSYSAGPVALAARWLGIPVVICEQNILPGITNRMLARLASRIYVSFAHTHIKAAPEKLTVAGNPVRRELLAARETGAKDRKKPFTVLVLGGSQGAHRLNEIMMKAMTETELHHHIYLIHQTGEADEAAVRETYTQAGVRFRVQAFFDDMSEIYHMADLVICRAGATTIAELTALGKAAIFIPYPYAADNHQEMNAAELVMEDAAEMIREADLTVESLLDRIEYYAGHPESLAELSSNARRLGKPDAARIIAEDCLQVVEGSKGQGAKSMEQRA